MFFIEDKETPVVLLSAGIGVTPVLSMLEHIAAKTPDRPVVFIHCNRDVEHVALKNDIHAAMVALKNGKAYMFLSAPPQGPGCPCMKAGRLTARKACGLSILTRLATCTCAVRWASWTDMKKALADEGFANGQVHAEIFGTGTMQ